MGRIRSRDTSPEWMLRRALWDTGLRYRLHVRTPYGRPDLLLGRSRVVVFIDGCFWHGCPEHYVCPRSAGPYWSAKLRRNVERDRRQTLAFEAAGWSVCRVWEHELFTSLSTAVARIRRAVAGRPTRQARDWRVVEVRALDETGAIEERHLESLRDPHASKIVCQGRTARKWRVPQASNRR